MILAVPAAVAGRIVPGLIVPDDYAPIVNAHFRCDLKPLVPPDIPPFVGIIGGVAEWVFRKREVVSRANGTVEIREPDGAVIFARDELAYERILEKLRGPGEPYVHLTPHEEPERT